jgi:hypothetical protein
MRANQTPIAKLAERVAAGRVSRPATSDAMDREA